jgi:hypothetical protein
MENSLPDACRRAVGVTEVLSLGAVVARFGIAWDRPHQKAGSKNPAQAANKALVLISEK